MNNHPNRGKSNPASNPSPEQIRAAREQANLTQTAATAVIYCSLTGWQQWDAGTRRMHPAFWELFNIKVKALNAQ